MSTRTRRTTASRRRSPLSRRAFLAGIGGTAVALPFLDVMRDSRARAAAPVPPKRYAVWFSGNSTGTSHDLLVPTQTGADYELTGALAKLAEHGGIKSEISIVSGLQIPWEENGVIPAGGRPREFHSTMMSALLAGMRSDDYRVRAATSDQVAATVLAGDTAFDSIEYRIQASFYRGDNDGATISFRDAAGEILPNPPIASPRVAYDALFRTFSATDPAEAERRRRLLAQDRSVIDLVRDSTERLVARLGREDAMRLERHFDEIRALETRLATVAPDTAGACQMLPDPGEDPPIATMSAGYNASDVNTAIMGYANEEQRARVLCDLMYMAFVCDLTRVASMMVTYPQSFMSVEPICGVASDLHEMSHGQGDDATWSQAIGWVVGWFGYLAAKLRDAPEGDGSVLDNSGLALVWEGGWGYDPADDAEDRAHSTENMSVLVAGRAGGLQPGVHIQAIDGHPAQVLNTVLHAVGVESELGEVSGEIAGLRNA
jgi:hypothetical protein